MHVSADRGPAHAAFLAALPAVHAHARAAFRTVRCPHARADAVAEAVALAWAAVARRPARTPDPTRLARAVVTRVRAGGTVAAL